MLFLDQIFKMKFLTELYVLISPEFDNHIFRDGSECVYVSVSVINIAEKYNIDKTGLKTFYKDRTNSLSIYAKKIFRIV